METELEPLIRDQELWKIQDRVMAQFPELPSSTRMWTAILGSKIKFAVDAPHPKQAEYVALGLQLQPGKQMLLREQMDGDLAAWREYEKERKHYAGHNQPDMEYQIFRKLASDLSDQISTLKSIID